MKDSPGLHLPNALDTLLLQAALHPDGRGLAAWQRLRPHFSVEEAHPGQRSLLPLVHRTLCATGSTDPDRERLAGQRRFLRARWAQREGPIGAARRRLEEAAIPVLLVGEAARAERLDGNDASLRDLQEIDLLVHPADRPRAAALLGPTDSIRLVGRASDRLARPSPAGDPAWEQAEPALLAGGPVLRPSATDLLLHTLVEGTRLSHRGRIRWAADAALLIAEGGIDWRRLAQQAEQRRVALTTAAALTYLATALEVPLPPEAPTRIPGGWKHGRERWINQLWNPNAQGPCRRNAVALELAQSAAEPPLASLWGLGRRAVRRGATTLAREGAYGLEVLQRIRQPPPLFGTAHDQPAPAAVTGTVVVASTPRSGSSLLCLALERTGLVGVPREYFLPSMLENGHRVLDAPRPTAKETLRRLRRRLGLNRWWWGYWEIDPSTMAPYIQALVACRSSANGIFALKIHWEHFEHAHRMGFCLSQLPQPITWIHCERRDRIAQAVSFEKAMQTGAFNMGEETRQATNRLRYDDGAIMRRHERLQRGENSWKHYFQSAGITPVPVVYEDLAADYEGTISRVLEALGHKDVPVPAPPLQRQANAVNKRWIEAFRHNHPEFTSGGLTAPKLSDDGHPAQP
ncbi:MAG: Stf0 family sulfotransferase [Cyanobacteriota bacterium]|nr:Stf0 family sulfotransferase [Cyanobacteriota bacterium]